MEEGIEFLLDALETSEFCFFIDDLDFAFQLKLDHARYQSGYVPPKRFTVEKSELHCYYWPDPFPEGAPRRCWSYICNPKCRVEVTRVPIHKGGD